MNIHKNARLTPHGRAQVIRQVALGRSARRVAGEAGVSATTVHKWVRRARAGEPLTDRSCRPRRSPQTTAPATVLRIEVLRRQHRTCAEIASVVGVSRATVARIVRRCGWARLHVLDVPPPLRRSERAQAGELVHLDIKKLARIVRPGHRVTGDRRDTVDGVGWEFAHMAVDDASRWAFGHVLPDERGGTAVGFLHRTGRGLRRLGVRVAAVMTDNGACYLSRRFAAACRRLRVRHLRTHRYTPRTNGKVERFIKTSLLEGLYAPLSRFRGTTHGAGDVAAPLQLAPAPHQHRREPPDHPGPPCARSGETSQLASADTPLVHPPSAAAPEHALTAGNDFLELDATLA